MSSLCGCRSPHFAGVSFERRLMHSLFFVLLLARWTPLCHCSPKAVASHYLLSVCILSQILCLISFVFARSKSVGFSNINFVVCMLCFRRLCELHESD
ncbi:hypothetical protein KC19_5G140600 [Ceratodon purpureus]|uniref:Secreted protein n=1 Tax=Ceratodon purpureus TaxID=3225 RepID=A0A8T0I3M1_CERPU|nr:hypothetical protein KC19_5G140600 [Ceratodon purpureus]